MVVKMKSKELESLSADSRLSCIDGFYVWPFQIPGSFGTRYIYCKEEISPTGAKTDRLFLVNVGDITEEQLIGCFSSFGEISNIEFGRIAKGGSRVAYIKFVEKKSFIQALKVIRNNISNIQCPSPKNSSSGSPILEMMLNTCHQQYDILKGDLRKTAEEALMAYNEEQNAIENETDADGWTVIRRRPRVDEEEMINAMQLKQKKRRSEESRKDFYKFQGRESKRDQLKELRDQFEKDKEKIEKMKRNRKFNPT